MLITDSDDLKRYASHRVWPRHSRDRTHLYRLYSGNTKEIYGNFVVVPKSDGDADFGEPILVAHKLSKYRCFDPVLWIDPLDQLWFFWNVMPGEEVFAIICEDPDADTLVWSEELYIGRGIMMNKSLVLSAGEWLFPIALWKLEKIAQIQTAKDDFLRAICKFMEMQTLTPILLRELIEKIEVFPVEGKGKDRTQRVNIRYRFVGRLDIPGIVERPHFILDSRQGVAIEYLPNAI